MSHTFPPFKVRAIPVLSDFALSVVIVSSGLRWAPLVSLGVYVSVNREVAMPRGQKTPFSKGP